MVHVLGFQKLYLGFLERNIHLWVLIALKIRTYNLYILI
jgi:hypothetical protein